jgi:hypothetical protein
LNQEIARQMIEIYKNKKKRLCEYDIVKTFEDENEAKEYAKRNNIPTQNFSKLKPT